MNIVLDLDETLIHTHTDKSKGYDFVLYMSKSTPYYVKKRPRLTNFLNFIYKEFNTVNFWTAGTAPYAQHILRNILSPQQQRQTVIVYSRGHLAVHPQGHYYKPLDKLFKTALAKRHGIQPHNTIMIDDVAQNFVANIGNGLVIPAYTGQPKDKILSQLVIVLKGIKTNSIQMGSFNRILYLKNIVN